MGKKSLLSSTSKKKSSSEKSGEKEQKTESVSSGTPKKVAPKPAKKKTAPGTAVKKKTASQKAAPEKTVTPGGTATAKSSAGSKTEKTEVAEKKPVSIRALLAKKFDVSVPDHKYAPSPVQRETHEITSPPFVVGETPEETERIRRLLFKKFDLTAPFAAQKPEPEPKSVPQPPVMKTAKPESSPPGRIENGPCAPAVSSIEIKDADPRREQLDPMQKIIVFGGGVFLVLVILVLGASLLNSAKFYLKPAKGDLEIWRGTFSPEGTEKIFTLSPAALPSELKDVYSKEEAFTLIFESYVSQADALLDSARTPDFELIKRTLNRARPFAAAPMLSDLLQKRLAKIDMMTLVYKADVLAGKGTVTDVSSARNILEKAMRLNLDEAEKGLVRQKITWVDQQLETLEQTAAAAAAEEALPEFVEE